MIRFACAVAALSMFAAAHAAPPARAAEPLHSRSAAARSPAAFRHVVLEAQNAARAQVGTPALAWSETLAAEAAAYAAVLARTGRFQHARLPPGASDQGENLWMGTRDAYTYRDMVERWIAERRGRGLDHYTQIVWRTTNRVGCALASGPYDDYLVCRYHPAGNIVGERPF